MAKIPFFGIKRQYQNHKEELLDAVNEVYTSGMVLDGPYTQTFEQKIAARCQRSYAVAVNSCSMGLFLALKALSIESSSVILPTVSFSATLNAALMNNNVPVYCDIDDYGLIDLGKLDYNPIKQKIQCLMYVNLFGNIVDYDKLRLIIDFFNDNKIVVIEDAAQSFGASYKQIPSGKLGDISVLSFDPTKNLPNFGSGGMILTDDYSVHQVLINLRDNGKLSSHMQFGTNSKMNESDCAQMLVRLKYFDQWQRRRTEIAEYYIDNLRRYVKVTDVKPEVKHAWHKFPIWVDDHFYNQGPVTSPIRHRVQECLRAAGVETKVHYNTPLSELGCNPNGAVLSMLYPWAEAHSRTELSLPIYPELTDYEVEYIVKKVIDCILYENNH